MSVHDFKEKNLPTGQIEIDGGTQARVRTNDQKVAEYAELIGDGVELPRIVVFFDGVKYWLADGFHRYLAHLKKGLGLIDCLVARGTKSDAILYACGANAEHGIQRTPADKRRAVEIAFRTLFGVSDKVPSTESVRLLCKVSHDLAGSVKAALVAAGELPGDAPVAGRDGRTIVAAKIGPKPAARLQEPEVAAPARDPAASFYDGDGADEDEPESPFEAATRRMRDAQAAIDIRVRELGQEKMKAERLRTECPDLKDWLDDNRRDEFDRRVTNAQNVLKAIRPHAVCGYCRGERCGKCRSTGFLPQAAAEAAPVEGQKTLAI